MMPGMKILASPGSMQRAGLGWTSRKTSVGFVPTMGALHAGHLALIARARRENKIVVVSIFVNPAQFGPGEDYSRYPRPFRRDAELCRKAGVDVLFRPSAASLYPSGYDTWVSVGGFSQALCGPFRPGHFRGVATVVLKLLNMVMPTRAYFGLKDYQQTKVIERLARDLNLRVRIVPCRTVREPDGLALSSRNAYLSPSERAAAALVPAALRAAAQVIKSGPRSSVERARRAARGLLARIPGARVQYASVVDPDTLAPLKDVRGRALAAVALYVGKTRLIDNLIVRRHA
jgi:pantoate--beta-alanine ligase